MDQDYDVLMYKRNSIWWKSLIQGSFINAGFILGYKYFKSLRLFTSPLSKRIQSAPKHVNAK